MRHLDLHPRQAVLVWLLLALGGSTQAWGQSQCRERAQRLSNAAQRCRQRVASGEIQICTVNLSFRNNQQVSIQEAESLAAAFNQNADRYDALQRNIQAIREKIALDKRAVTMHGFNKQEQDFEDWVNLSAASQKEFEDSVVSGAIDSALLGVKVGSKQLALFNTSKVNKLIKDAKALGIDNPLLFESMQAYGRAKNKKDAAKAIGEVMERLQKTKDAYQMASDRSGLKATATLLGWCIEDPKLSLLVTETDIAIAALFNNATRRVSVSQIESLSRLTEEELRGIQAVSSVMKQHVERLKSLKSQLASLSTCS